MSVCNLGRPPQDAGLQNLLVNDTLRVNNLLKATKVDVERLCATVNNPSVTLVGSHTLSVAPGESFNTFLHPSGHSKSTTTSLASLFTTFWTDEELVVDDLRAVATTADNGYSLAVSIVASDSLATLGTGPFPNGTELGTVTLANITATPVSGISELSPDAPAIIPAGSYVSILASNNTSVSTLNLSWSLRFTRVL
jgi:hypothetical protein